MSPSGETAGNVLIRIFNQYMEPIVPSIVFLLAPFTLILKAASLQKDKLREDFARWLWEDSSFPFHVVARVKYYAVKGNRWEKEDPVIAFADRFSPPLECHNSAGSTSIYAGRYPLPTDCNTQDVELRLRLNGFFPPGSIADYSRKLGKLLQENPDSAALKELFERRFTRTYKLVTRLVKFKKITLFGEAQKKPRFAFGRQTKSEQTLEASPRLPLRPTPPSLNGEESCWTPLTLHLPLDIPEMKEHYPNVADNLNLWKRLKIQVFNEDHTRMVAELSYDHNVIEIRFILANGQLLWMTNSHQPCESPEGDYLPLKLTDGTTFHIVVQGKLRLAQFRIAETTVKVTYFEEGSSLYGFRGTVLEVQESKADKFVDLALPITRIKKLFEESASMTLRLQKGSAGNDAGRASRKKTTPTNSEIESSSLWMLAFDADFKFPSHIPGLASSIAKFYVNRFVGDAIELLYDYIHSIHMDFERMNTDMKLFSAMAAHVRAVRSAKSESYQTSWSRDRLNSSFKLIKSRYGDILAHPKMSEYILSTIAAIMLTLVLVAIARCGSELLGFMFVTGSTFLLLGHSVTVQPTKTAVA